ncbi:MAG: hypothetical protein N2Z74_04220 [Syntrophales bacterium]|nr:hypothetical protein [Syntrophales bacterium]
MTSRGCIVVVLAVYVSLFMAACGRKGDPSPVSLPSLPPRTGLSLEKSAEFIAVVWLAAQGQGEAFLRLERAAKDAVDDRCPSCPPDFESIAEFAVGDPRYCEEGKPCLYRDYQVRRGNRYLYRLLWCDEKGRCTVFSEIAEMVY